MSRVPGWVAVWNVQTAVDCMSETDVLTIIPPSLFSIRNSQYYEKVADPLDLTTIEKQILTGHYKTVEAFDTDMLKVFRNAEVCRCPRKEEEEEHAFKDFSYSQTNIIADLSPCVMSRFPPLFL